MQVARIAVVAFIVALIIGVAVGWVAKPIPPPGPEWVSKADYDALKADYGKLKGEHDKVKAELDKAKTELERILAARLMGDVPIGFLAPLTGDLAKYGENSKVAIELAVKDVNEFLEKQGAPWRLKLEIEDTGTLAAKALEKLMAMHARGIKIYVGPMSSAEVKHIKAYADANKLLIISQSSTAPALGIKDDFIYRFCPNDLIQGPAIARVMFDDGIRYVVPVWRGDAWGDGLKEATQKRFEELGGTFVEGIRYPVPVPEVFTAEVATLAGRVKGLVDKYGAEKVGVLYMAFAEAVRFFLDAREQAILWKVKWYGSDGTVLLPELVKELAAAEIAAKVNFINTIFAPTLSPKYERVKSHVEKVLGRTPDAYVYGAYDIIWATALSLLSVDKYDSEAVRVVLPTVAENYFGASGWVKLDPTGDRATADYDLWIVREIKPGVYEWKHVGVWVATTDSITWFS